MSVSKKHRARFSLNLQIIAFSFLFLLALPWLGNRYMDEMKEFLVQGQGDAQLLAAQAIATVLHNRADLFNISNAPSNSLIEQGSLYVYPLDQRIVLDGYGSDWNLLLAQKRSFGPESLIYDRTAGSLSPVTFGLLLGEYNKHLYGLVSVNDSSIVYRHPQYSRLDSSDQVRIELVDKNADIKRYVIITEAAGTASVYEMHEDWARPLTGQPVFKLNAIWRETAQGYDVEFRFPINWLSNDQHLMISVADVSSDTERKIDTVVATLHEDNAGELNKLIIRSPELDRIIKGLGYADSNVCIVDRYRRVRAVLASQEQQDTNTQSQLCTLTDKVAPELVAKALLGESSVARSLLSSGEALVLASHPIYQDGEINGAVLVEKNSANILFKQKASLNKIIIATAIVVLIAIVGLLLFSSLLAYRIRNLQKEVSSAFDLDGRLIANEINSSSKAGDEVGELSRVFSTLLSQLKSYTGFLESVPRTLRHEILNPLNTISMALQKMSADQHFDAVLISSANKASKQLELIVHSLTEAAHIDDSLSQDEKESFDLAELLSEYVSNISLKHKVHIFSYTGQASGITIQGSDLRISQMLDKLKDNAIDFSDTGSEIKFELSRDQQHALISICNEGKLIPDEVLNNLCSGIISHRHAGSGEPHLGIGLYVASRIARYHNGSLNIFNTDSNKGVCVEIELPIQAS
ncbi:MAG: ATP-binding protein [Gammaproteobacteria bacterium]|nr:ATP-binding protein [Gammaproteobacteria bacterium]